MRSDLQLSEMEGGAGGLEEVVKRYTLPLTGKHWGWHVHRDDRSYHRPVTDREVVKRGDPKSSPHKEKIFFSFFLSFLYILSI